MMEKLENVVRMHKIRDHIEHEQIRERKMSRAWVIFHQKFVAENARVRNIRKKEIHFNFLDFGQRRILQVQSEATQNKLLESAVLEHQQFQFFVVHKISKKNSFLCFGGFVLSDNDFFFFKIVN